MKFNEIPAAKDVGELSDILLKFIAEHGRDWTWNGWDDGSLILRKDKQEVYIEPADLWQV